MCANRAKGAQMLESLFREYARKVLMGSLKSFLESFPEWESDDKDVKDAAFQDFMISYNVADIITGASQDALDMVYDEFMED